MVQAVVHMSELLQKAKHCGNGSSITLCLDYWQHNLNIFSLLKCFASGFSDVTMVFYIMVQNIQDNGRSLGSWRIVLKFLTYCIESLKKNACTYLPRLASLQNPCWWLLIPSTHFNVYITCKINRRSFVLSWNRWDILIFIYGFYGVFVTHFPYSRYKILTVVKWHNSIGSDDGAIEYVRGSWNSHINMTVVKRHIGADDGATE